MISAHAWVILLSMSLAQVQFPVRIRSTGHALLGHSVSTRDLVTKNYPKLKYEEIISKTGIHTRHWTDRTTTFADQAVVALEKALAKGNLETAALKRLIFVSSSGGDALIPATANHVLKKMGLHQTCACMDLNNACMGFLSAMDIAMRWVASGVYPVAVVVSEKGTSMIDSSDPRPYLILGDGAVAVIFDRAENGEGVISSFLGNDPRFSETVTMAHPNFTDKHELIHFNDSNSTISKIAMEVLGISVRHVLTEGKLSIDQIHWAALHQPNSVLFKKMTEFLEISEKKTLLVSHRIGSLGAASVAFNIDFLFDEKKPALGELLLICGVGSGLSYGAFVYQC